MIPYMVGKLAPNSSHLTRGLVKYVPGRSYFRAVPSQNRDKFVTSCPPNRWTALSSSSTRKTQLLCCTQLRAIFFFCCVVRIVVEYPTACNMHVFGWYLLVYTTSCCKPLTVRLNRKYTALIGDPTAMQILTHNPSPSSVLRYPVALSSHARKRHHQSDLPRATTPRAFARVNSLPITIHPVQYCT